MNSELSAKCTKWCCRILALVVIIMIFAFPAVLGWFRLLRHLSDTACAVVMAGFYLCVPVVLYAPGLQDAPGNRALAATLAGKRRELKNWGVVFVSGGQRKVITAQKARLMKAQGLRPGPGAVLTPLAKEILGG